MFQNGQRRYSIVDASSLRQQRNNPLEEGSGEKKSGVVNLIKKSEKKREEPQQAFEFITYGTQLFFPWDDFVYKLQRRGGPQDGDQPWIMLKDLCVEYLQHPPSHFMGAIIAKEK